MSDSARAGGGSARAERGAPRPERVSARDARLVPVAVAAWGACWAGTSGRDWSIAVLLGGAAGCLAVAGMLARCRRRAPPLQRPPAWWARPHVWLAVCLVVAVLGGLAWTRSTHLHGSAVARLAADGAVADLEVQVNGDPRHTSGTFGSSVMVPSTVRMIDGRGERWTTAVPVILTAGTGSPLADASVGSRWRLTGRLAPPEPAGATAAFVRVLEAEQLRPPAPGWRAIERVRTGLRTAVADRPPGPRALVPALVVGDTTAMTPELRSLFVTTGLTHLTAVSGANLTLLLGFVMVMIRWVGVRGRWLTVAGLATVAVFVALCRTEPSVLRATAMGLVALAAIGYGGTGPGATGRGLRHLCVAVVALMVVDPWLGRSIGFALSTLATAGILVWAGGWASRLDWAPRVVAEGIAVPLAAQLATQPVVSAISGQISVVGLLANALAGPLVGPATVAGFAAAGLSQVHPVLASGAGWLASWPAQGIIWIARATGSLPGAAVRIPATPVALIGLGLVSLLAAWWTSRLLSRPWACGVVALALVALLLRAPAPPGWPPTDWRLVMCDVGQGDAAVVRIAPNTAVVVDTGPDPLLLTRCLDQLDVRRVPLVVLSHYHADHIGGLDAVLDGLGVELVLTSPVPAPAAATAAIAASLDERGIAHRTTTAGDRIGIGTTQWETLWPTTEAGVRMSAMAATGSGEPEDSESAVTNDASVVGRLTTADGVTVLFTGDIEPTAQSQLIRLGTDLHALVLKVPHHGSSHQDPDFLAAVGARWAITSSEEGNSYGHPAPRTVHALQHLGMTVLRTDTSGAVAIGVDDRRWVVRTQR